MDEYTAAILWSVVAERRSFLVTADPRKAGKSTVSDAALHFTPPDTPIHRLSGQIDEMRQLAAAPDGGYLVVGEISTEPPERYIWGEPVSILFETLNKGFSLNTTLHTAHPEETFAQICHDNEISDEDASRIQYVAHVERRGGDPDGVDDDELYWRRVAGLYEITAVKNGIPTTRQLTHWNEPTDTFTQLATPSHLTTSPETLAIRATRLREFATAGRTTREAVTDLIAAEW